MCANDSLRKNCLKKTGKGAGGGRTEKWEKPGQIWMKAVWHVGSWWKGCPAKNALHMGPGSQAKKLPVLQPGLWLNSPRPQGVTDVASFP